MGISAVVITLNEEVNIERCLGGLAFADEIIVVDSLSSDRTVELARKFTDRIEERQFTGYSDQKSYALSLATNDWVLIVDADEAVTGELAKEIVSAVESGECDGYRMPRLSYFLGRPMRRCGWYPDYQLRLARKERARFPHRLVHETLEVDGKCGTLKSHLVHYSYRNMDDYLRKMAAYSRAGARQRLLEGGRFRLTDLLFRPGFAFFKKYVLQAGFAAGLRGFVLSGLSAYSVFLRYAIVWDLSKKEQDDGNED